MLSRNSYSFSYLTQSTFNQNVICINKWKCNRHSSSYKVVLLSSFSSINYFLSVSRIFPVAKKANRKTFSAIFFLLFFFLFINHHHNKLIFPAPNKKRRLFFFLLITFIIKISFSVLSLIHLAAERLEASYYDSCKINYMCTFNLSKYSSLINAFSAP